MFTSAPDPRSKPEAADVVRKFRVANYEPEGGTLYTYASIQVWAQAVERAGALKPNAVIEALRSHEFDTVLGRIGFDDNGDVTGMQTYIWYAWKDGQYVPERQD
jgi:branched-chain amino acid transport system substrate-binding protein